MFDSVEIDKSRPKLAQTHGALSPDALLLAFTAGDFQVALSLTPSRQRRLFNHIMQKILLKTTDHARNISGMQHVYPVLSRRAGGISIGINLNPNNACNWQCIYCQVPNLTRGAPPHINLDLLQAELNSLLAAIEQGSVSFAPEDSPHKQYGLTDVRDVAFSGNGEPTSAAEFPLAVSLVHTTLKTHGLDRQVKIRLITNGSLLDRPEVQAGIQKIGMAHGEIWFKIDSASTPGMIHINGVDLKPETVARRLALCASLAPTWVQTCLFALDNAPPDETEIDQYLALIAPMASQLQGVHLYSLARPSPGPEGHRPSRLDQATMDSIAKRIRGTGLTVHVSA